MTQRPLKIMVASSGLGHVSRGIEAWAGDLARALAERGENVTLGKGGGAPEADHEVVVPCLQRGGSVTQRLLRWLPRRFTWRLGVGTEYGIEQTTFAANLLATLRQRRIDVLHVQDPWIAFLMRQARRLGWIRTRTILGHGTNESSEFLRPFPYVQHLAPWHLEQCRAAGVWRSGWTAIPNFIDTERFRCNGSGALRAELGLPANGLVVLTAAAIKRSHKRIDHLLHEFARVLESWTGPPLTLVIAGGREPETDELICLGQELLGDHVRFLVCFPRERMPDLYRLADLFVLCSLREMMPVALLEATSTGLPCLVHRHPILEWMTGPGGVVVDMEAPGALAAAISQLSTAPESRTRLSALARQHCETHFSRDRVVSQLTDYYRFVHSCRS